MPEFTQPTRVAASCKELMNYVYKTYLPNNHVDKILIAARWDERDLSGLKKVLAWAEERAIPVTVFGPMVEYDLALPRILAEAAQRHDPGLVDRHREYDKKLEASLHAIASQYNATYISLFKVLCPQDRCLTVAPDGVPLEFDGNHLTKDGSLFAARKFIDTRELP
jgi:hypothetical protein